MEKLTDGVKIFVWGLFFGIVLMYVMLTYVLKDASYYKGVSQGTFTLSRQLINDLAKH